MFDIGFGELMVIALVALVVIGPERLPGVARTVGHLFGRLQRYVNDVKADISREIEIEDLKKIKRDFEDAAQSVQSAVRGGMEKAEAEFKAIGREVEAGVQEAPEQSAKAAASGEPARESDQATTAISGMSESSPDEHAPEVSVKTAASGEPARESDQATTAISGMPGSSAGEHAPEGDVKTAASGEPARESNQATTPASGMSGSLPGAHEEVGGGAAPTAGSQAEAGRNAAG